MKNILGVYLLALFCVGLTYLSTLPLWEGFDENAHYSSLRQIADTGTIPIYGESLLDREITDYQGPNAYISLRPPFDQDPTNPNYLTYAQFFSNPSLVENYKEKYREPHRRAIYAPGVGLNWQAQHPAIYYAALAPLTKATDQSPLVTQVFVLRLASYIFALCGIAAGFIAVLRQRKAISNPAVLGFLVYPILLPMLFPEFARLGNDAFCLLITGIMALFLSLWLEQPKNKKWLLALGFSLGIGLLTKAFFLPIGAGLGLFFLLRVWAQRKNRKQRTENLLDLILVFVPAFLLGGGWYAYKFLVFGDITGSADSIKVADKGGLVANLKENFSVSAGLRSFLVMAASWVWGGTQSLTHLPKWMQIPCVLLVLWVVIEYLRQLRMKPLADPLWLPVWMFGLFAGSLFYYAILTIALSGNGGAPGWYLHILMPWTAPALGIGFMAIWQRPRERKVLIALLGYAALFHCAALWSYITLYTGCSVKGDDKNFAFPNNAYCLDQLGTIYDRLTVIGYPWLAIIGLSGAIMCTVWLIRNVKTKLAI